MMVAAEKIQSHTETFCFLTQALSKTVIQNILPTQQGTSSEGKKITAEGCSKNLETIKRRNHHQSNTEESVMKLFE